MLECIVECSPSISMNHGDGIRPKNAMTARTAMPPAADGAVLFFSFGSRRSNRMHAPFVVPVYYAIVSFVEYHKL